MKTRDLPYMDPAIIDWVRRRREEEQKDHRMPLYDHDEPPPGWAPETPEASVYGENTFSMI